MKKQIHIDDSQESVSVRSLGDDHAVTVGDREYRVSGASFSDGVLTFSVGHRIHRVLVSSNVLGRQITVGGRDYFERTGREGEARGPVAHHHGGGSVEAPMPGTVVSLGVATGDDVEAGAPVVVIESMKMQNELTAPMSGKVTSVSCRPGEQVAFGAVLVEITPY